MVKTVIISLNSHIMHYNVHESVNVKRRSINTWDILIDIYFGYPSTCAIWPLAAISFRSSTVATWPSRYCRRQRSEFAALYRSRAVVKLAIVSCWDICTICHPRLNILSYLTHKQIPYAFHFLHYLLDVIGIGGKYDFWFFLFFYSRKKLKIEVVRPSHLKID